MKIERWTRLCAVGLGLVVASTLANAQNDRWQDTSTGWSYLYGATSTQVNALGTSNQRVFNIERIGSNSYDAVAVTNSGAYSVTGSQVSYGLTATGLSNFLTNNNRRILDLEAYDNAGVENFIAVTVPNTGATAAGWGWLVRVSQADINSWIANSNPPLRLIDIDTYTLGGTKYYTAVAINNTGSNQLGWWYYWGRTATQVNDLLTTNNARLVDISIERAPSIANPTTLFNVVMVANNPGAGWWYSSLTSSQVDSLLAQNGARLTALTRYTNQFGQTRFAAAMVDNANAETRRLRDGIRADIPTGSFGFMAKQVGGPVLTSLNENFQYEPASMLKILHSARAMREIQTTASTLNTTTVLNTTTTSNNSCPFSTTVTNPTLRTTIQETMRRSSNEHTEALRQRYGTVGLNNFAATWDLPGTSLNHTLGCLSCQSPVYNTFTARDAVRIYEQIANGSMLNEENKEELLNSLMLNYNMFINNRLTGIINSEAASTDLTTSERAAFHLAFDAAWKGGSYNCNYSNNPSRYWRTDGGWARIPFKGASPNFTPFEREYALAIFLHDSTESLTTVDLIYNYMWEQLRIPIRQALQSWDAACSPDTIIGQPVSISRPEGSSAQFSVTHTNGAGQRTYQWRRYSNGLFVNMSEGGRYSGTNTATLTISGLIPADATLYSLRITKDCGIINSNAATLTVTAACAADFDGNGILNFFDFSSFIGLYNAQDPRADLASPFGVWNFFDVSTFISLYNAGCP